jgi:hypothetical protein
MGLRIARSGPKNQMRDPGWPNVSDFCLRDYVDGNGQEREKKQIAMNTLHAAGDCPANCWLVGIEKKISKQNNGKYFFISCHSTHKNARMVFSSIFPSAFQVIPRTFLELLSKPQSI